MEDRFTRQTAIWKSWRYCKLYKNVCRKNLQIPTTLHTHKENIRSGITITKCCINLSKSERKLCNRAGNHMSSLEYHLKELKSSLLRLNPTGCVGFEGLIAAVLHEITGIPFQLAAAGKQDGIDGATTSADETVAFECKRYDGPLSRSDLVAKLADFGRRDRTIDAVWVLATTSSVSTQTANDLNVDGERQGVFVTLLDWHDSTLSRLATTLAIANDATVTFLENSRELDSDQKSAVKVALSEIRNAQNYNSTALDIRKELNVPSRAFNLASQANRRFLTNALGCPLIAKNTFGQSLTPTSKNVTLQPRKTLTNPIAGAFTDIQKGNVLVVHGDEGCGKSWAVMQTWSQLEHPPLTLFLLAQTLDLRALVEKKYATMIKFLIEQTETESSEQHIKRWMNRWEKLKTIKDSSRPRLVVVLDGLNQQPADSWPSVIEWLASLLEEIGGVLIVTVRTAYYRASIKDLISIKPDKVTVPEWTDSERNTILETHKVDPLTLDQRVLKNLANPRLLGLALDLLDKKAIEGLYELDGTRLLFEHIRTCARSIRGEKPPRKFAKELTGHANEVRKRLELQQTDDLWMFPEKDLPAVADGRFFKSLPDDPMQYELRGDGVTLALGFGLVEELRKVERRNESVFDAAAILLGPIAALDESPSVIVAGLNILCLDEEQLNTELVACLLIEFSRAQNLDHSLTPALMVHVRRRVQAFLKALENIHLSVELFPNVNLLEDAVMDALHDMKNREIIDFWIRRCLNTCPCPKNDVQSPNIPSWMNTQEAQELREWRDQRIESNRKSLSDSENEHLSRLHKRTGDVFALHRAALRLLARRPIAPFASELVSLRFIYALYNVHTQGGNLFRELCWFNIRDWSEMRTALVDASNWLGHANISTVGQRAYVDVLQATGNTFDATKAYEMSCRLQPPSQNPNNWSLRESLCETDPCNPDSLEPENLQHAVEWLPKVPSANYRMEHQIAGEFIVLKEVLLPLARHRPKLITNTMKQLIDNVAGCSGAALQEGLYALERHRALVTFSQAKRFADLWLDSSEQGRFEEINIGQRNALRQNCLQLGFHNFDGDCHLKLLVTQPPHGAVMLTLFNLIRSASESALNGIIKVTDLTSHNESRAIALLLFIAATRPTLTEIQKRSIGNLFDACHANLALHTLMVAIELEDHTLLQRFTESNWASLKEMKDSPVWPSLRSQAFLTAGRLGLINAHDVFSTIAPEHFGMAIRCLTEETVSYIADLLKTRIEMESAQISKTESEAFSRTHGTDLNDTTHLASIDDSLLDNDLHNVNHQPTKKLNHGLEQQESVSSQKKRMVNALDPTKMDTILLHLVGRDLDLLLKQDMNLGLGIANYLTSLQPAKRHQFRNPAVALAYSLAHHGIDDVAAKLLDLYRHNYFAINLFDQTTRIPVEALYAWRGPSTDFLDEHRFMRLDTATTDHAIAQEVLAAELGSNRSVLYSYITDRSGRHEPSYIARAIMVAGFMDENQTSTNLLKKFANARGFVKVTNEASFAYQRNIWAQHWHERMLTATKPTEFWCAQMLFEKIVDGRFYIWSTQMPVDSLAERHQELIQAEVGKRCKNWQRKRRNKLFGASTPDKSVLDHTCSQSS